MPPRIEEQARKARAERLLQLRSEGMSPGDAWNEVKPGNKAKDPAEMCRREIREYRKKYCVVDEPGEDGGLESGAAGGPDGASLNGTAAEVPWDAATKPAKLCIGVEGGPPCSKEVSGRSPRCEDCRAEHERLRKQRNNRNNNRRHKEEYKERALWKRLVAALCCHLARLQEEEERCRQEAEKRRQKEEKEAQEAERRRREKARAEWAPILAAAKAEEERKANLPKSANVGDGLFLTTYPDGRRFLKNLHTGRVRELQPGEPIPVSPPIQFADDKLPPPNPSSGTINDWLMEDHLRRRRG